MTSSSVTSRACNQLGQQPVIGPQPISESRKTKAPSWSAGGFLDLVERQGN